ncbi:MAG: hypothetical protein EHM61_23385 [Acidobacteria bacterium]|nr:MAG: hypothetical protein EHM61_23385 [Acidobacteriota bacterium]
MSLTSFLVPTLTSSLIVAQTRALGSNPVINYGAGENAQCIAPENLNRDIWPVLPANDNSDYVSVLFDTTAEDTATTLTALPASPTYFRVLVF